MLKPRHPEKKWHRQAGRAALVALALATTGVVYAASRPAADAAAVTAARFTLKVELAVGGQPARLHANICLKPGQYYTVTETDIGSLPPWHGRFTVVPVEDGLLEVQAHLSGGSLAAAVDPRVRTHAGQTATIQVGQQKSDDEGKLLADQTLRIDLTPSAGC